MGDKGTQVRLKKSTVEKLKEIGNYGESLNDIIERLLQ